MSSEHLRIVSMMTVSQFRAYRKALSTLVRAGICTDTAIIMLLNARAEYESLNRNYRAS